MIIILTGPPKTCGNDEQRQTVKIVILGLDPGIQGLFNINTKDTKFIEHFNLSQVSTTQGQSALQS